MAFKDVTLNELVSNGSFSIEKHELNALANVVHDDKSSVSGKSTRE